MSIQLIWKRLINSSSSPRVSIPLLLLPPLAINAKPHTKVVKFCTGTAIPSPTSPDRGVATDFLINKCGMTEKDVSKAFQNIHFKGFLYTSSQDLEEGLELLNECGLTTLAQIRKVVICNPRIFLYKSKRDLNSRLSFLRSFIRKDDMCKLIFTDSRVLARSEEGIRSAISALQRLGFEGEALSKLVAMQPRLLSSTDESITESFKVAEGLGIKKGSQIFGSALRGLLGAGKEKIDLNLQCLSRLGFSEKQIYELSSRQPWILGRSEKSLRRKVEFLVKSVGFSLDDFIRYSCLFTCSLEKRIVPRYRVMVALKNMTVLETEIIFTCTIVQMTEKRFLEKYVDRNAEFSSALRDIYYGEKAGIVNNWQGDTQ